jgi:hypothetical protein
MPMTVNGTATSYRQCGACGAKTFTSISNQQSCTPWTTCKSTEVVSKEGTSTTDRECTEKVVVASGANSAAISAIVICSLIVGSALLGAFIYFYYPEEKEAKGIKGNPNGESINQVCKKFDEIFFRNVYRKESL